MPTEALLLVTAAALIHAAWNALAKRGGDQVAFLWAAQAMAGIWLAPVALWRLGSEGLPAAGMPYVVATIVLHALYFYTLGSAYRHGEFSLVYPVARGLGVAVVPALAYAVWGERLSPLGVIGIALVVAGILALHVTGVAAAKMLHRLRASGAGTAWALATGLVIAVYSVNDKVGVSHVHPVVYITLMGFGVTLLLAPVVLRRRRALALEFATNWRALLVASTLTLTGYLLVLFAFRLSKTGYVVAAREMSIVLSVLIGRVSLGEQTGWRRLAGAMLVFAGVACVALAR
jgi:drug/metabolite transporter (DMT)-like permease